MAISEEKMAQILGRAGALCSPEFDRMVESKSGGVGMADDYDAEYYDSLYLSDGVDVSDRRTNDNYNYSNASYSRMPDAIKQSMINEQIDTSSLAVTSQLDRIANNVKRQPGQRQVMNETQRVSNQSIDYSVLRAIINECIDTKLKEYFGGGQLNESALKTVRLKEGNIQLIDNGGKVFEAKLNYKGKIKK